MVPRLRLGYCGGEGGHWMPGYKRRTGTPQMRAKVTLVFGSDYRAVYQRG